MGVQEFLTMVREQKVAVKAALDPSFVPASIFLQAYQELTDRYASVPVAIAVERGDGHITTARIRALADEAQFGALNNFFFERLVKSMLWVYGGWRIVFGGPASIGRHLQQVYTLGGVRDFDVDFMDTVYEKGFVVEVTDADKVPADVTGARPVGRHLDGCRIGFDAGGSDRKVSAVVEGEVVYSEEVVWHPKTQADPQYHYDGILAALRSAAEHMPRVDGIGVSTAGVIVSNRPMVSSLFLKVPKDVHGERVKNIYIDVVKNEMGGIPFEVANDGDVTALAGAIDLDDNNVLGIAMGTSEAGGFVDGNGNITGWLNELAFVPADFNPDAMVDEWSGDFGCGVKYFSQDAVIKLAPAAGITLDEGLTPAEKLKAVQKQCEIDPKALEIFDTIGVYLGYQLGYYAFFYDIRHVLILGRVTSGEGGHRILDNARKVLDAQFPDLARKIQLHLPDESNRRVGQSIAAASLPAIS